MFVHCTSLAEEEKTKTRHFIQNHQKVELFADVVAAGLYLERADVMHPWLIAHLPAQYK